MTYSTPDTILDLMETCRDYYCQGPKHLLQDGVVLRTPDQVAPKFVRFIFAEDGARFAYLRKLEIAFDHWSDYTIEKLEELLKRPELSLETFILREAECLLQSHRVSSSLRALNPVKNLVLHNSGPKACSLIRNLPFRLVNLTISFIDDVLWPGVGGGLEGGEWSHLIYSLSPHSQTLETLRYTPRPRSRSPHSALCRVASALTQRPSARFGAVRTLGLTCNIWQSHIATLVPMFPNVTCLELLQNPPSGFLYPFYRPEWKRVALNRGDYWAALTKCSGALGAVYSSGLACPVAELCIWGEVHYDEDFAMLTTVVAATQPKCLRLDAIGLADLRGVNSALRDIEGLGQLHMVLEMSEKLHVREGTDVMVCRPTT